MARQSITIRPKRRGNVLVAPSSLSALGGVGSPSINIPPTDARLRVGFFNMATRIGRGPGNSGVGVVPYFSAAQWNPHVDSAAELAQSIATADALDILLIAMVAGGGNNYGGGSAGGFNQTQYRAQLDEIHAYAVFNDAVARGRIHLYIADEPNNFATWGNTFTPTRINQCGLDCKLRWPGALTYVRLAPHILRDGWGSPNMPGLSTYSGIDYGWLQYALTHRRAGKSFAQALAEEKAAGAGSINVGVALSVNLVNAGYKYMLDGINPCWDYDLSGNPTKGIVIGAPADPPYSEDQKILCSQITTTNPPNTQELLTSPAVCRRAAEVAKSDPDAPFLLYWTWPGAGAASPADMLINYTFRSDFDDAFTYAINQGLSRDTFNGYRTAKRIII